MHNLPHEFLYPTEGASAELDVSMKWSVWSANAETWKEQAPTALKHMKDMYNNHLKLNLSSIKEIRYGTIDIYGTSECSDAPGDLIASGCFWEEFDDGSSIIQIFSVRATSISELLILIDKEEEALIEQVKAEA